MVVHGRQLPGGHAARTRRTMNFTRMPIKGGRTQVIDQVSISFVMNTSKRPPIKNFESASQENGPWVRWTNGRGLVEMVIDGLLLAVYFGTSGPHNRLTTLPV